MAPLEIEVYNPAVGEWTKVGEVGPQDHPGSFSDNKPEGHDVYLFECAPDDSHSTIYRSKAGADVEVGSLRAVAPAGGLEVIRELRKNESIEMEIRTDVSPEPRRIRLTHR